MSPTNDLFFDDREYLLREVHYDPLSEHARHRHDHPSITLILSGALEEGAHGAMHRFGPYSVVIKPAGVYHADRYGPRGTRTFQLAFDPGFTDEPVAGLAYAWERGGPVARAMFDLYRCERAPAADRDDAIVEVLACAGASSARATREVRRSIMAPIRELIDAEPGKQVSVGCLAREMRMHPVSLARAFRREFGCSIREYIRRGRVAHACALLDEADPLADIAVHAGFADQPHLTRAFKTETGVTPAHYRRLASNPGRGSNRSRPAAARRVF